jgi:hypothetical protein
LPDTTVGVLAAFLPAAGAVYAATFGLVHLAALVADRLGLPVAPRIAALGRRPGDR